MQIVAISGWKRSGKDTCANHLVSEFGFKRVAFADRLKDMVAEEYGIPRSDCDDPALKEKPILNLQVDPRDAFSRVIAETMVGEFRSVTGQRPSGYSYVDGSFYGLVECTENGLTAQKGDSIPVRVYWNPRALCIFKGSGNRAVRSDYWVKTAVEQMQLDPDGRYVISDIRFRSEADQLIQFAGKENVRILRLDRFDTCESTDASERDLDTYEFDKVLSNRASERELLIKLEVALGFRLKKDEQS